ncbi:cilium assembly protein DZIP1-like [Penaeus indicus]|uniref:cilium assembly protein DZIP1-like n=1 Tax=Penaeus indicus TaxID=29960 RepID=UPI00300C4CDE
MRTRLGAASPAGGAILPPAIEFPSQRRERVDWHKLASVDLHDLASGCSIEFLQENLSHVAFCDAESEFDLGTMAGQRSLLKMFRLAQLIIQYLFLSQDYMESQLQQAQEDAQQVMEKYQQVKSKLLEQVEEAKKMKMTNKSMRETVKYVNSFALANGIFQSLKCPLCTKAFRGQDFLQAHLWRKHPQQANVVTIPQVPPVAIGETCPGPTATVDKKYYGGPHSDATPLQSVPTQTSKTNDVESYRIIEMEKKFNALNDNFSKFMQNMEEQKRTLEKENERRQEEVKKAWEDKSHMEQEYKAELEKLNQQINHLQRPRQEKSNSVDVDRFVALIKQQESEIKNLQLQIENQLKTKVEELGDAHQSEPAIAGLSEELNALRKQLSEQRKSHKRSLNEMKESMRSEYEKALDEEKNKLKVMMQDLTKQETPVKAISQKPPPSPKTPSIRRSKPSTPPTPNRSTKPSVASLDSPDSPAMRSPALPGRNAQGTSHSYQMDAEDTDDDTEDSETDTSRWTQATTKITQLQVVSPDPRANIALEPNILKKAGDGTPDSENSSFESSEDEDEEANGSSESLKLETLLRDNPQLWEQMKSATSEVLAKKLSSLGLEGSVRGIKTEVLTSCLSQLRKERRKYEEKYEGFLDLRKRLENEVNVKADEKIENVGDISGVQPITETVKKKGLQAGMLSRVVKNVKSKVRERSKSITSTMSKTSMSVKSGVKDMFNASARPTEDIKVVTENRKVSLTKSKQDNDSSSDTESEESSSSSAQIEVHNETSKSVTRNLFGSSEPLEVVAAASPSGSGARPKQRNYFDNKTYGQVEKDSSDSEWDSEPEYENMKKEPPVRSDSLAKYPGELLQDASSAAHNNSWDSVQDSKPIKLKKPQGEMVSNLSRTIELQLSGRRKTNMAGAVDVMSSGERDTSGTYLQVPGSTSSPHVSRQQSVSDSSNTVRSSMWGSLEDMKDNQKKPQSRPSGGSKAVIHSWDSEDDLDISEIE